MAAGPVLLGLMGLGLTLALAGKKKKNGVSKTTGAPLSPIEKAEEIFKSPGQPVGQASPVAPPAPNAIVATGTDWAKWAQAKVGEALTTNDSSVMKRTADELLAKSLDPSVPAPAREMLKQAAQALLTIANEPPASIAIPADPLVVKGEMVSPAPPVLAKSAPVIVTSPGQPTGTSFKIPEVSQLPPAIQAEVVKQTVEYTGNKATAMAMVQNLLAVGGSPAGRYKENRTLVKTYQAQEKLTADGLYGVQTGLTLIKYDIIPPKPFYFSKDPVKTAAAKKLWTTTITAQANKETDAARKALWMAVSDVSRL